MEHAFAIRSDVPTVGRVLDRLLSPFRDQRRSRRTVYRIGPGPVGGAPYLLWADELRRHEAWTLPEIIDYVLWTVYEHALTRARRSVVLHAAVASSSGRGILLPGASDAGKTTLVAGLTAAGFAYLSDEAAPFDPPTGTIHAFPRPLGMELSTLKLFPGLDERLPPELRRSDRLTRHVPASILRRGCVGGSCRIRYVVSPSFRKRGRTRLVPLSRARALMLLVEGAFNRDQMGREEFEAMGRALGSAQCWQLEMADLPGAVGAIREVVEGSA